MENLYRLMLSPALEFAKDASEKFDKGALLQIHEFGRQQMEAAAGSTFHSFLSFTEPTSGGGGATSLVPLERLNPISFSELQVGEIHHGKVMYGTLCAEAFGISGVMTLLENGNGLALRLAIYNAAPYKADVKGLYPRGAKVAVKEPCFKRAADGSVLICVHNPVNVVMLTTQKEKWTESLLDVDVEEERKKGNGCFREQKWDAAAEHYTKCIDAALLQLKDSSSNGNNDMKYTSLLHSYSNRAEAWLKMMEFKRALEDSDEALRIDAGHFKTLYRKGRALLGLRRYAAACEFLGKADKASPGLKQIRQELCQAKTLYAQSRFGKYDISDYLLGRTSLPPEVADFAGHVEIKMTEDGRGRGLFATREIGTGQLLLVSNAVAVVYESAFNTVLDVDHRYKANTAAQEDLVAAVLTAARKSQRLLRQLYSLDESSASGNLDVPGIDLFRTDGQEEQDEKLKVDVNRIRDISIRNSFRGDRLVKRGQSFVGLWLLPSFINHSCLPNSSWLEVGSATFIHASKPIKKGEEITIPYFDTLVPLPQREAMCKGWGFSCKCRRCNVEQSLTAEVASVNAQFQQLHAQFQQLNDKELATHRERLNVDLPIFTKFLRLSVKAEEIIRSSPQLKTKEEKNWIRASYLYSYFEGARSNERLPAVLENRVPSVREIMEAVQNTVPGDIITLLVAARGLVLEQSEEFKHCIGDECQAFPTRRAYQARDACIRVFGRHSEDVLEALVLQHGS